MYDRYIPAEGDYVRVSSEEAPEAPPSHSPSGLDGALAGLLRSFHLERLDAGDVLLVLIILLILLEDGDGLDMAITLGLMLLLSLGEP